MASAVAAAAVVLAVAELAVLAAVVAEPAPAAELVPSTAAAVAPLPAVAAAAAVRWKLQHIAPVQSVAAAVAAAAAQVPCTVPCQPLSPPTRCPQADELSLSLIPWWQSVLASSAPPAAVVAAVGGSHMLGRLVVDPEQGNSTVCLISKPNFKAVCTWDVTVEGAVPGKPTSLDPPGPVGCPEYCTVA